MDDEQLAAHYGPGRTMTGAEWVEWNRRAGEWRERALTAEAERDRLRVIVEAARGVLHLRDASREVDQPSDWDDESGVQEYARRLARATVATSDALDVMADRLAQLDGSTDMGGGDT